ncbi:MAG: hypothetical protein JNL51_10840 [Chitinophagaceae bacterium]|nr:hypothetical protein [Chitinophagaceae bacterium]
MKELLQSIFKTTEERVKNPFLGAFTTSWILFNWKPIVFLFFADKKIEDKFSYLDTNFSSIQYLFLFPLYAAVFYVLLLPYLSLIFELLLKTSLLKRNQILINRKKQNIDNATQVAIEEIKFEEAKTEYRERSKHNKLIEELQKRNQSMEQEIENLKESNRLTIEELKSVIVDRDKMTNEEFRNFEIRYSDSRKEIKDLTKKLFERDQMIQEMTMMMNNRDMYYDKLRGDKLNKEVITRFGNGLQIVERYDGNKIVYYDSRTNEPYSESEVKSLMEKYPYEKIVQ